MSTETQNNAPVSAEPVVTLNGAQLLQALDFIAPDRDTDPQQLECELTISFADGPAGSGYYCYCTDYPDEGAIMLDAEAPAAPVAAQAQPYSLDMDPAGIRALTADAISGALALGFQGVNPPPNNEHWLAPFWEIGRESAAQAQPLDIQPIEITDSMALAFHNAITDGSVGQEDVDDIKTGLRAVLANILDMRPQAQQPVSGAGGLADYPTHGMNLGQRIAHVGGRENAQGYVEFGSPMAVHALIQHVLRDFHLQGRVNLVPAQQTTDPLQGAADWLVKDCGVSDPAGLANRLGIGYNRASRLVDAARKEQA